MKYLFISLLFLTACKKDMETPRHQIIIVDDDYNVDRCGQDFSMCLPVTDLEDLEFQVITSFALPGNALRLLAIPCHGCGDYTDEQVWDLFNAFSSLILADTDPESLGGGRYLWTFRNENVLNPEIAFEECFRLCIYRLDYDSQEQTLISAECLGATNCFTKVTDLCHTTKVNYFFNENSMGFYASKQNTVRLPMYLSRPQFPGEEKGYQKSDGTFLKLNERVNKEWTLTTDYLPEALHERIRIALSADNITIWNENENLALEGVYRDADYEIGWPEEIDHPVAMATTKIKKRILQSSLNSNCA